MKTPPARNPKHADSPARLCTGCRRTCKQPSFAKITSCPRYYPLGKKQAKGKEWKQQDLFSDS